MHLYVYVSVNYLFYNFINKRLTIHEWVQRKTLMHFMWNTSQESYWRNKKNNYECHQEELYFNTDICEVSVYQLHTKRIWYLSYTGNALRSCRELVKLFSYSLTLRIWINAQLIEWSRRPKRSCFIHIQTPKPVSGSVTEKNIGIV